ncbi:hypothetical protein Pan44_27040 [Caulifigura coniformis]|uniref:Transmembrane protein n=2 Tax=Caulifigura coniformis TaxID=2527983 RepID=A0A517SEV7_9PLAN|nr:hypothetical protein Pan44_27040 [Caulifigura coniformis]
MPDAMQEYRQHLVLAREKSHESYDKLVTTLSAGGLGVTFTFLGQLPVNQVKSIGWLFGAWVSWSLSIACVLASFFCSAKALNRAIEQVDAGKTGTQPIGGKLAKFTEWLNVAGGATFVLGAFLTALFIYFNLGGIHVGENRQLPKGDVSERGYTPPPAPKTPAHMQAGYVPPPAPPVAVSRPQGPTGEKK